MGNEESGFQPRNYPNGETMPMPMSTPDVNNPDSNGNVGSPVNMKVSPTTNSRDTGTNGVGNGHLIRNYSGLSTNRAHGVVRNKNRNRRPSFRSRPTKRDIADLASTGRSQSSFNVLCTGNGSSGGPPRAAFMGLKRTKSEIGSEPHSSFAMDLNDPLDGFCGGFDYYSTLGGSGSNINSEDEINRLADRLGSRRVSITSQDDETDDIAKIVAQAAFPASTLMSSMASSKTTQLHKNTEANQKKPCEKQNQKPKSNSITSTVRKFINKKNLSTLSKFQKPKKPSLKTKTNDAPNLKSKTVKYVPKVDNIAARSEWTEEEDILLKNLVKKHGVNEWKSVQEKIPAKTATQIQYRWNKVLRPGLRKGTWTKEEDEKLIEYVTAEPKKNWGDIASLIEGRSAKQCRERWCYNLDPSINKNVWNPEEDRVLVQAQSELGNRWAHIASLLPGRTENAVKTRFKSIMRAKKREWLPEEDDLILRMHQEVGSRWDTIAEKLPNRTKNAVKTRFRQLGKGQIDSPTTIGAPNQILRRDHVPVKSSATLAELTDQIAKAHEQLTGIDDGTSIMKKSNRSSNTNANGIPKPTARLGRGGRAKTTTGRGSAVARGTTAGLSNRTLPPQYQNQNQWNYNGEQKQNMLNSSQYQNQTDPMDDFLGIISGESSLGIQDQYIPKGTNLDSAYFSSYPVNVATPYATSSSNVNVNISNNFDTVPQYISNSGVVKQQQGIHNPADSININGGHNLDTEMEDGFDLLDMLR